MDFLLRFSRNLSFVLLGRLFSVLANLTFLFVSARYLGPVDFGKLILILAIMSFLELGFSGVVDSILVREQSQRPGDIRKNFQSCMLLQICFSVVLLLTSVVIAAFSRADTVLFQGLLVSGLASSLNVLLPIPISFFRAIENMKFEAVLIMLERCLFLSGFAVVIALGKGTVAILGCLLFSVAVKVIAGFLWFNHRWQVGWRLQGANKAGYFLVESSPLMLVAFLFGLRWRVDLFLLTGLSDAVQLGIYAASYRLIEMCRVLPIDVITAAFPIFCKLAAEDREKFDRSYHLLVKSSLIVGFFLAGLIIAFAGPIIRGVYGPSFADSSSSLRLLMMSFPLMFWSQLNNITLTAFHRQKWIAISLVAGIVCQVGVDLLVIPTRGAFGAATGFLTSEIGFWIATLVAVMFLPLELMKTSSVATRVFVSAIFAYYAGSLVLAYSMTLAISLAMLAYAMLLGFLSVVGKDDASMVWEVLNSARGFVTGRGRQS